MAQRRDWLVSLAQAEAASPEAGRLSALLLQRGSMQLRYYAPKGHDPQTPHDQDEIYIIARGRADIVCGASDQTLERRSCMAGDAVFVAAGVVHRFVDFSEDFASWVIFWGPQGGERP